MTEPFLRDALPALLARHGLARSPEAGWEALRRQLRLLGRTGGPQLVHNRVVAPLAACLGYTVVARQEPVATREGVEDGGWRLTAPDGTQLRAWSVGRDTDLDAPRRQGRAYRFSPTRCAQRVLLACRERAGLLTDGDTLRLLLCDPARPDSHVVFPLAGADGWRNRPLMPDSFRAFVALASPAGLAALPGMLDAARQHQALVTSDLRRQARAAVTGFIQAVLDNPANAEAVRRAGPPQRLAETLWQDGLVLVYRLLFILRLESAADPARAFSFASTRLWRTAFSPGQALAPLARRRLDQGHDTGSLLAGGLRAVFRLFRDGLACRELSVAPLGGALFGAGSTRLLDDLAWGDPAVAMLLDRLLWTPSGRQGRERIHYGPLDVEDLGRVYEALLELEPGIATEPMVRLRRAKQEVVVPATHAVPPGGESGVAWGETLPAGRFFLRAGSGRKATGSYYTPHGFVRFLVREALAPIVRARSPDDDPDPGAILALKVVDPATGSGHFLVEACRFLGEALYTACRLCDEQEAAADAAARTAAPEEADRLRARAAVLRQRLADLPDRDRTLLAYLPSRACEGGASGLSERRALALCRRLVAVHCLYGVDRNPLAIELAKLSLWLESYAEGLPLTFLDHRLVRGDSLAGPSFAHLATLPVGGAALDPLLAQGVADRLAASLHDALAEIRALDASIGRDAADIAAKEAASRRLDRSLTPLRQLARAWSGAAALATREGDDEWLALARTVAATGAWPARLTERQAAMCDAGRTAVPWDLAFPDVFRPDRGTGGGFDAVLGNPPWDVVQHNTKDFVAGFDLRVLDAPTRKERAAIERRVLADPAVAERFAAYRAAFARQKRLAARLYHHQKAAIGSEPTGGNLDLFRLFAERAVDLAAAEGAIGMLMPSAFHANEGTTGIRRLYLHRTRLDLCLSFENRRRLFDIDSRFKFALVVARRPGPTRSIRCAFYLDRIEQVDDPGRLMVYDLEFLTRSGGACQTPLELRGAADLAIAERLYANPVTLARWRREHGIRFGRDLHMTDDADHFVRMDDAPGPDRLPLHEGKTFHQFSDTWDTAPRYAVPAAALAAKPAVLDASRHFRLAFRDVARSSDERTMIAAMMPPGVVFGHTATVEKQPDARPDAAALVLCAVFNSFPFDWLVRQKAAAHLSLYLIESLPMPGLTAAQSAFLARGALRLSCNHAGYAPLWRAQPGAPRREAWPVLRTGAARWAVRAALDAVIAHAYGLTASQYARVLDSFSHTSWPEAPVQCRAAFDSLAADGMAAAFPRDRNPYVPSDADARRARRGATLPDERNAVL